MQLGRRRFSRAAALVAVALTIGMAAGAGGLDGVVGNKQSKKYHRPDCKILIRSTATNHLGFDGPLAAEAQGYVACRDCRPGADLEAGLASLPQDPEPQAKSAPPSKPKGKLSAKAKAARAAREKMAAKADAAAAPATPAPADDGTLKFSRDIAPVFVGNCINCHNPERRRGGFDLTTFAKLMGGSESGKVIVPGNPDESPLVQHLRGEVDPKMPPGNRTLADETIAKIESWVKDGASLDEGVDAEALLSKIAPSADDLRKAELAKLTPEEQEEKVREVGLDRWKKASPSADPETTGSTHFLVFGRLPKERAERTLKVLEAQYLALRGLLSMPGKPALELSEKISVYVFNTPGEYAEFVRSVMQQEVEGRDAARANLAVEQPFLVAADPLAGADDPEADRKAVGKRRPRGKSADDDEPTGPDRTLDGLLAEQLAVAAAGSAGQPPRWLRLGLGAYVASQVEPRSPYIRKLRTDAARQYQLGWTTKATETLGDQGDPDVLRAVGFSLVEWLVQTNRPLFPGFARGMMAGGGVLDQGIKEYWNVGRTEFIAGWGQWVAANYGRSR